MKYIIKWITTNQESIDLFTIATNSVSKLPDLEVISEEYYAGNAFGNVGGAMWSNSISAATEFDSYRDADSKIITMKEYNYEGDIVIQLSLQSTIEELNII